jgi:hypothetical protein
MHHGREAREGVHPVRRHRQARRALCVGDERSALGKHRHALPLLGVTQAIRRHSVARSQDRVALHVAHELQAQRERHALARLVVVRAAHAARQEHGHVARGAQLRHPRADGRRVVRQL